MRCREVIVNLKINIDLAERGGKELANYKSVCKKSFRFREIFNKNEAICKCLF